MSIANTGCPVDPTKNNDRSTETNLLIGFAKAALMWFFFGFRVIPLWPGTKKTFVKWNGWLEELSPESIHAHWAAHPGHEVGFIVGVDLIVFDADTPMAVAALVQIEESFDVTPLLVMKTIKGQHHYFRRAPGTYAKSAAILIMAASPCFRLGWNRLEARQHEIHQRLPGLEAQVTG